MGVSRRVCGTARVPISCLRPGSALVRPGVCGDCAALTRAVSEPGRGMFFWRKGCWPRRLPVLFCAAGSGGAGGFLLAIRAQKRHRQRRTQKGGEGGQAARGAARAPIAARLTAGNFPKTSPEKPRKPMERGNGTARKKFDFGRLAGWQGGGGGHCAERGSRKMGRTAPACLAFLRPARLLPVRAAWPGGTGRFPGGWMDGAGGMRARRHAEMRDKRSRKQASLDVWFASGCWGGGFALPVGLPTSRASR